METIIYVRWSTDEQSKGDSKERQLRLCRDHAKHRGWNVIREEVDEGQSAFTGDNRRFGKLGELQRDFEANKYPEGVILLVEDFDRLSREAPGKFFLWLSAITEMNVTVATVEGARVLSGTLDMADILHVIVKASIANEQSENKSRLLTSAWGAKRTRLASGDGHVMTARVPGWLTVSDERKFCVHPDHAATVKRIFEETAEGAGKHTIARRLNEDKVATFGRSTAWHASYIQKILNNSAVIGEFQPGIKPSGAKRQAAGPPISNYFPAVIDADLYSRARYSMKARARKTMGPSRRIANLFSGIAKCRSCQSKMTLRNKGTRIRADGQAVRDEYLVCDAMQRGIIQENGEKCRNNEHFNYQVVENGVLKVLLSDALDDSHFADESLAHQLSVDLAEAKLQLARLERTSRLMLEEITHDESDEDAKELYRKSKRDQKPVKERISEIKDRLLAARGRVPPEEHSRRIASLMLDLNSSDDEIRLRARMMVRLAITELVQIMHFDKKGRRISMTLLNHSRLVTISADDGHITYDIVPSELNLENNSLTDRQRRAQERVLKSNRDRSISNQST